MSEKRFVRIENENGISIKDTETGYERYYAIEVLDDLNDLNDENEQLKEEIKKYKPSIYNKKDGDWKWNVNNNTIINIKTNEIFYLRNSGAVENLVGLLNELAAENDNYHKSVQSLLETNLNLNNQLAKTQADLREILSPNLKEGEHLNCRCNYEPIRRKTI